MFYLRGSANRIPDQHHDRSGLIVYYHRTICLKTYRIAPYFILLVLQKLNLQLWFWSLKTIAGLYTLDWDIAMVFFTNKMRCHTTGLQLNFLTYPQQPLFWGGRETPKLSQNLLRLPPLQQVPKRVSVCDNNESFKRFDGWK